MIAGWSNDTWTTTVAVATPAKPGNMPPRPVDLVKRYWRGADIIYSANFRPPRVPKFPGNNTTHTGEHSG